MENALSDQEKVRYARNLNIPEIGESGQKTLKDSAVLIVGAGGLGSASSMYLAAAGVGRIGIVDSDAVEVSNLQRQILHSMQDLGVNKAASAQKRLLGINPEITITPYALRIDQSNVRDLITPYPIVLDATDNFETRYLINQTCVSLNKVFIYGAVYQFYGQMSVFSAAKGPCFQCVFQKSPTQEQIQANRGVGVVGALPGMIGCMQALEAIKHMLGIGTAVLGRLILVDGLSMSFQEIQIEKDLRCPICSRI